MKKAILIILGVVNLFGWEINTHRAIERQAVRSSSNFNAFLSNSGLSHTTYWNERFEGYYKRYNQEYTYFNYVEKGEPGGISSEKWKQAFANGTPKDLIEAGAILEDAVYEKAPFAFNGRFNNHFYDAQNGGHPLTYGYGLRVNDSHPLEVWGNSQQNNIPIKEA